jgi:arsenate reductase
VKVTIYQKPTCSTCREVYASLLKAGVDVDAVNYYTEPLTAKQIKALLKKMGAGAKEILRTKEPLYKELGLAGKALTDDELIALMVEHPDLLQRPIVEAGDRAILARPAERIIAFLAGK